MRAMILAAGRGKRMRHLTEATPKPLLTLNDKPIISHLIEHLKHHGVTDIVINVSYLGAQIKHLLGDGRAFGVHIVYSEEPERLETGGGVVQALPLLGDKPFLVVNGDLWTDYPFGKIRLPQDSLGHLVLVPNPAFRPNGDYGVAGNALLLNAKKRFTVAGITLYSPDFFRTQTPGCFPMAKLWECGIRQKCLTGELYEGVWWNIGTPEALASAEKHVILG